MSILVMDLMEDLMDLMDFPACEWVTWAETIGPLA